MSGKLRNTLTVERARLGWSQARMAEAVGVSRQSYAAIESGRSVPSTDVALRLAAAVGRSVAELFLLPDAPAAPTTAIWSGLRAPTTGDRVRLTRIGGRPIAHPCAEAHSREGAADGMVQRMDAEGAVGVHLFAERPPHSELAVIGCDPAFGIVAEELRRERGIEVSWTQRGSRAALAALGRGEAHLAGAHLDDGATGTGNEHWIRELVPFACTRITFAVWEQGLVVRPDGRRISSVGDLADGRARLLNREEGSGSRVLLDQALAQAGVDPGRVAGYATAAQGHLAVADGVAAGTADVGIAIRAAGRARGLDFLLLREEAYELIVPDHFLELPAVDALIGLLRRPAVRTQVEALGGYDGSHMGH